MSNDIESPLTPTPLLVQELAPTGKLRAAINFGNAVIAQRDPASGEARGVAVDLANALGRALQVPVELVEFDAAGKVVDALAAGLWDIAFLAIDPLRGERMAFSGPYMSIEGTYLVKSTSTFKNADDLDTSGTRIAVGSGAAYELYLTRTIKQALITRKPTAAEAFQCFLDEDMDAVAGVRQVLGAFARRRSGLRVLDDRFMSISQAVAVPKARTGAAAFLNQFVEAKKADGSVADSLMRSGQTGSSPTS